MKCEYDSLIGVANDGRQCNIASSDVDSDHTGSLKFEGLSVVRWEVGKEKRKTKERSMTYLEVRGYLNSRLLGESGVADTEAGFKYWTGALGHNSPRNLFAETKPSRLRKYQQLLQFKCQVTTPYSTQPLSILSR